jgi:hypothetical protein
LLHSEYTRIFFLELRYKDSHAHTHSCRTYINAADLASALARHTARARSTAHRLILATRRRAFLSPPRVVAQGGSTPASSSEQSTERGRGRRSRGLFARTTSAQVLRLRMHGEGGRHGRQGSRALMTQNSQLSFDFLISCLSRPCCETSASLVWSTPRSRSSIKLLCRTRAAPKLSVARGSTLAEDGRAAVAAEQRYLRDELAVDLVAHAMQHSDGRGELVQRFILRPDHGVLLLDNDLRRRRAH